ncbi:MAG TPA: hypothetical protein VFR32_03495 [Gaiellaceae bacterium]|nr:hypothetical protein [Gaiellaceae bacterium]
MQKLLALLVCALAAAAVTAGHATSGVSCHNINAKGVGQQTGPATTTATITGGGLLNGTTDATFTGFDFTDFPPDLGFTATLTFTTSHGTLTMALSGTLNVVTGVFTGSGPVTASTGKLAGATGTISFEGVQDLVTGAFTETVAGEICVDLSP